MTGGYTSWSLRPLEIAGTFDRSALFLLESSVGFRKAEVEGNIDAGGPKAYLSYHHPPSVSHSLSPVFRHTATLMCDVGQWFRSVTVRV